MEVMQIENVKDIKLAAKSDVHLHRVRYDCSDQARIWL